MSKIVNLKQYDLVFTTSFFYTHGVSGHLYEMIDYAHICNRNGITSAILLSDGVTKSVFEQAVREKYNFTEDEISSILDYTHECYQPLIIMANNVCIVDGSWRVLNCTMYADNVFLLRCSEGDFDYFHKHKSIKRTHLMQDFRLYDEVSKSLDISVIDYVKKILWGRYKTPQLSQTNTALLYLTTSTRATSLDNIKNVISKGHCDNYLIVTNDTTLYSSLASETVSVELAPVKDIFEKFDSYIYTPTRWKTDCSPRFIVECALYNKEVTFELDYTPCRGLEYRVKDIEENLNSLELTDGDFFVEYVKKQIYE
jgi:hypothetical protein